MVLDLKHPSISIARQCELLGLVRSSAYYRARRSDERNEHLMRLIDRQYLETPFYGVRRMTAQLVRLGHEVNAKRVRRLMRLMGLEAVYQKPRLSQPHPEHKVYPYLLRDVTVERPNQVGSTDITYIPMRHGWVCLVAILDWFIRYVLAWEVSVTLDSSFCVSALERALSRGKPEIFNSDQEPVHVGGLHRRAEGCRGADQHGRPRSGLRQHLHRTALADGQVRGGLPARLPDGGGVRLRSSSPLWLLQ